VKLERAWQLLGLAGDPTPDAVIDRWRELRSAAHPDRGGDRERFIELKAAYQAAIEHAERLVDCQKCHGTGRVSRQRGFSRVSFPCDRCDGGGKVKRF